MSPPRRRQRSRRVPALVLISVDGLSAAALEDPEVRLPALGGLAARGARAAGLVPVFPSVTWPTHVTLVTGASPARHGILGNHVLDREHGEIVWHYGDRAHAPLPVETLGDRAARAGLRVAAISWPRTREAASIADNLPECYEQALLERYASRPLWDELRAEGLPLGHWAEWGDAHALGPLHDWVSLEASRLLLRRRPPDLLLLHFLAFDSFQHDYGIGSPEARGALEYVDGLIARFLAALEESRRLERTDVLVVGDHGFVDVRELALPNATLHAEGLLRLDRSGRIESHEARVVANGGSAHVYVADGPRKAATIERLRERFAALPGVRRVVGPEEYPDLGLPRPEEEPTQGDLMIAAAAGWHFASALTPEGAGRARAYRGSHGHLPDDPRLHAAFVAAGPGVAEGARPGVVSQLDVAPTVAALLGLDLPHAQRPPLAEFLGQSG